MICRKLTTGWMRDLKKNSGYMYFYNNSLTFTKTIAAQDIAPSQLPPSPGTHPSPPSPLPVHLAWPGTGAQDVLRGSHEEDCVR